MSSAPLTKAASPLLPREQEANPVALDVNALKKQYLEIRQYTEAICARLTPEDYTPQPIPDVSPPKWHLAHTTWFFETFILSSFSESYTPYNEHFAFLFNSYYEAAGPRILRTQRGNLTRPETSEIYRYRAAVDKEMLLLIERGAHDKQLADLVLLGLHHEQQHQELLLTDVKYILGHNPLFPAFAKTLLHPVEQAAPEEWISLPSGIYSIGYEGDQGFCFDNERGRHRVFLESFCVRRQVVTVREYLAFMQAGGYEQVEHWLSEGWAFAKTLDQHAPLHWHKTNEAQNGGWKIYTEAGLHDLELDAPVSHLSYYEADAYARWAGYRLPTEFEWEAAHKQLAWGQVWEWTSSAYAPYPGFTTAQGALGEYNGKWMVNQQTLRGGSVATSPGHTRPTYRNFFHADKRWQYTGIRLAKKQTLS